MEHTLSSISKETGLCYITNFSDVVLKAASQPSCQLSLPDFVDQLHKGPYHKAGSLNARLAKWSILLSQFDIRYVPQKAIKGQALADFLAEHPLPKDSPLRDDLPDKPVYNVETSSSNASWNMYFDGAIRTNERGKLISGICILFVSPNIYMIPHVFLLLEPCPNNAAEYQALIIGLELALESGITMLEAFGDSQLIINQ
ncbi:hypothetical protein AAC387_Pa01g2412 [Persea americana]